MNQAIKDRAPKYHEKIQKSAAPTAEVPAAAPIDRPARPGRKPFGGLSLKLDYPSREGFHRHWFNDVPGRIPRAKEAGYEHVIGEDKKPVNRIVGTAEGGGALIAFLMEIPEEWYKADMAAEQNLVDEKEEMIRRGTLNKTDGDGTYIPAQGISIRQGS